LWDLGDGPLSSVVGEMETNGIITAQIEVCADKLDAFSQWSQDGTPYVLLAVDKVSGARRAFDAAHELGHLVLHRGIDRKRLSNPADWKILENQAHRFASAFLMPEVSFRREVWAPSLDTFAALKPRWGTSVQAMLMRCRDLGMLSTDQFGFLYRELSRRGWRRKEPHDDTLPVEGPSLIPSSVRMLVEAGVRRPDQLLAEMALPAADLEELTDMPRGYYTAAPAPVVAMPTPKEGVEPTRTAGETGNVVSLNRMRRP
jgi:Zn-dependent peptidase ImmA (M78 family)